MPSAVGQRWPSTPKPPTAAPEERAQADIKGKGRAYDYDDRAFNVIAEDVTQDALLQGDELDAMAEERGPGVAHDWAEPGPSSRPALTKVVQGTKTGIGSQAEEPHPTPSSLGLTDRFDWRLTASSFRKLKVANAHKIRKPPSANVIAASNTRSPELQARVQAYQDRLSHLVGIERAFERAEWERLRSRSQEELIAGGWTVDGLVGYWQGGSSLNVGSPMSKRQKQQMLAARSKPRVAILTRTGLQKLGWSRLKEGDKVELRPSMHTRKVVQDYMPKEEVAVPTVQASKKSQGRKQAAAPETSAKDEEQFRLVATVLSSDAYRLHLLFTPPHTFVDLEACQSWRLDLAPNEVIDAKVDEAIESLGMDLAGLEARDVDAKWEARGSGLTEALLPRETQDLSSSFEEVAVGALSGVSQSSIYEPDWRIRSWYERYSRSAPLVVEGDPDLSLNESQLKAVATMLSSRLSLIQGPPGTGKTHTLVSTIKLLKHQFAVPHPVLLCAHTNVAVDNLVDGAISAGLNVVRVGPSNSVSGLKSGRIEEVTLEKKMEKHHLWARLEETKIRMGITKRQITALYEREKKKRVEEEREQAAAAVEADAQAAIGEQPPTPSKGSAPPLNKSLEIAALRKSLGRLAQQAFILTRQIQTTVLYEADVVCSTLISSSSASLKCIDFPLVFIDECTQALEVLSLLPLMKGARQVALIGDHKQLPPVLRSKDGKKEGGARSLFERLVEEDGWATAEIEVGGGGELAAATAVAASPMHRRTKMQMLQVQHRMHPILASFPNQRFYAGQLQSAPRTQDVPVIAHSLADQAIQASKGRLVFIDHTGLESVARSASEVSLCNLQEIELLLHLLYDLLTCPSTAQGAKASTVAKLSGSSIGIIAPYLAQSRLIGRLLRPLTEQDAVHPLRRVLEERLGPVGVKELEKVEVNTVDGFQGREKDVIIFSAVRCSAGAVAAAATTASSSASAATSDSKTNAHELNDQQQLQQPEKKYPVGFLADARRLNVALTRAKSALFVLGNLHTWRNAAVPTSGCEKAKAGPGMDHSSSSASTSTAPACADSLRSFAEHVEREGTVVSGEEVRRLIGLLPAAVAVQEPQEVLKEEEVEAEAEMVDEWDGAEQLLDGTPVEEAVGGGSGGGDRGFGPPAVGAGDAFGRAF
ncbi:P-loop containing nucleoside triphosphate hydrolase protein [Microstroma glucosiphilum]|uniref:P-loop containing nucleoside triphosphate hydrolase protein n=1 Tax=Pseudomicrostroma glucosiphilum TaxID=1684307 RepID=A0A316U9X9_9BASI|nr:P-loop containing nucleoside triphosphate hydrolase protein [Pseudomicrostroma glucosiphilum]PWN21213.1 P-loop containing nucleoside triphosphate hydrolase protein [Pseudomicrostroma glucosiphilum]